MQQIAAHPGLRKRPIQESLGFLRFCGSRLPDFRRYVFLKYLRQVMTISLCAILASAAFPLSVLFGKAGSGGLAFFVLFSFGIFYVAASIRKKRKRFSIVQ
jgi:lipopolysaccharide export LptBFGC system permease protein LptF